MYVSRHFLLMTATALLACLLCAAPAQAACYISTEETLAEAAEATGTDPALLSAINNIPTETLLPEGTLLTLPEEPQLSITVQPGDTLYGIARTCGVELSELAAWNGIEDAARIHPGQVLYLPLAEEQTAFAVQAGQVQSLPVLAARSAPATYRWPVKGVVSSAFGERSRGWHWGLDIAADEGTTIVAAMAGEVTEAGWKNDAYGYTVMLRHADGSETLYAHCSRLLVEEGAAVKQGESIAEVGSTGNSTGPHVHFEIRIAGSCCDPLIYLP